MNDEQKYRKASYAKALATLHQRLELLDGKLAEFSTQSAKKEEMFENYGGLVKGICQYLKVHNFNFYAKTSAASPNLGAVLSVRGPNNALGLQYIKIPVDNLTVAGHVYSHKIMVNLADLHKPDARYPNLNPERMGAIDQKLNRKTRGVMAVPVLQPDSQTILAVIEATHSNNLHPFTTEQEEEMCKIAMAMANSFEHGFLSLILHSMLHSDKKSYVTTLIRDFDEEVSTLVQDDIVVNTPEVLANPASKSQHAALVGKDAPEADEEDEEETEHEEEDAENEDESQEEAADSDDQVNEVAPIKSNDPADILASLCPTEAPEQAEIPYESDGKKYPGPYDYLVNLDKASDREIRETVLMAETEEKPIEPFLIVRHHFTLHEIGLSLSHHYKLPYSPFDPTVVKPEYMLAKLKPEFMRKQNFLPVGILGGNSIKVICTDPITLEDSGTLRTIFGNQKMAVHITTTMEFEFTFRLFFGQDSASNLEEMLSTLASQYGATGISDEFDAENGDSGVSDNELVKLVNKIITDAYNRNVSDIHIEPYPGKAKTRIRFRVDGSLMEYLTLPSTLKEAIITRIKVMANLDISDRRRPQDGKIAMKKFSPLKIELRVATIPTAGGLEDAVMRILASGEPLPLEQLGILPQVEERLMPIIQKPYGILFVCGPTGSGKTTTLHSILKYLNTVETKIWTAEDPVEITQLGLRQVQINKRAGMDFATAMRAFLRCDPDIIMVGEMRDHETVSTGIEASLTGHLVMSTLHTNSAPEAVIRLLDMGMDPFNFADALLGILAQRLGKRLCKCKEAYIASDEEIELLAKEYSMELQKTAAWVNDAPGEMKKLLDDWRRRYAKDGKFTLQRAKGCSLCNGGYKGRVGLHELLVGTDRTKRLIQQKSTVEDLVTACLEEGMLTLKMDGIHKILLGNTDIKQVRAVCIK